MTYDVLDIAKYIIYHEEQAGRPVSNLRLQKLLYFVQGKFLRSKGEPCFVQKMEAWDFGPVVPIVYRAYRYYGNTAIPFTGAPYFSIEQTDRKMVDSLLDYCGNFATSTLVDITHSQDPWKKAYEKNDKIITPEAIYSYFKRN